MEDGRLMRSMLLDFYGELLTEKQRQCYDMHYNDDFSLSEIAEQSGISRQAVWLNIRRAEEAMNEMEEKLGVVRRAINRREEFKELEKLALELSETVSGERGKKLSRELYDRLNALELKG